MYYTFDKIPISMQAPSDLIAYYIILVYIIVSISGIP